MLASSSALVVVQPQFNGLGGDLFATIKDDKYYCINASGYAPAAASIDYYSRNGYKEIPKHGALSSFSIPGLVSAWKIAAEKSTMGIDENFKRAIQFARDGFEPSKKTCKRQLITLIMVTKILMRFIRTPTHCLYRKS